MKLFKLFVSVVLICGFSAGPALAQASNQSPDTDLTAGEKSPALSFVFSAVIPGLGQYYNGTEPEVIKGIIQDGGMICGFFVFLDALRPDETYGNALGSISVGSILISGCYLWSVIDAPISSADINGDIVRRKKAVINLKFSPTLLNDADLRPVPAVELSMRF